MVWSYEYKTLIDAQQKRSMPLRRCRMANPPTYSVTKRLPRSVSAIRRKYEVWALKQVYLAQVFTTIPRHYRHGSPGGQRDRITHERSSHHRPPWRFALSVASATTELSFRAYLPGLLLAAGFTVNFLLA
jgi:hypothetical protein